MDVRRGTDRLTSSLGDEFEAISRPIVVAGSAGDHGCIPFAMANRTGRHWKCVRTAIREVRAIDRRQDLRYALQDAKAFKRFVGFQR
jgi:hypothetical protein